MATDPDQTILLLQSYFMKTLEWDFLLLFGAIFFLLLCSALISGSEVAFFSLKTNNWKEENTETSKVLIKKLLNRPNHLLATILIANNFFNVAIIILSTYITAELFHFQNTPVLEFIIQVCVVTFLLLLLGEVIPKVFANQNSLSFASFMSRPIYILSKLLSPINSILVSTSLIIENHFQNKGYKISIDELSNAVQITADQNTNEEEKRILKSIVEFGNIDVKQIMKSRIDVIAFEENMGFHEVKEIILKSGYSRIPVYKKNFDSVIGILYIKDLLPFLKEEKFNWTKLIRTPFFVPESKMIDDLLKEFQIKKIHLAIVVDEYGGTAGIVTLEDIIEEIVGEINDEFDDDGIIFSKLDNRNYIFEGKTALTDVLKVINGSPNSFNNIKGDSDTLAGLILELNGKIPEKGDVLKYNRYKFIIESVDQRRVKRVKLTIHE